MAERVLDIDASSSNDGHPALLERHVDLLDAGLRGTAPRMRGLLRQMAAYHMGWTDAAGHGANDPAGKRIRPALSLWACEALGGDPAWALPAAVAVELIHNFTLIHDDIQDGDQLRRHRPAVWTIWGTEQGINAGDGMFAAALSSLLAPGPRPGRRMRAAHVLSAAVVQGLWNKLSWPQILELMAVCAALLALVLALTAAAARRLGFDKADEITIVFCGSKKSLATE